MGALADELSALRRGRGVMTGDLRERLGPTLQALAGVNPASSQEEARRRLIVYLDDLGRELPEDLRLAFSASLALKADVQHRFLEERIRWLAARLQRDVRTARRRVDEAIRTVAASVDVPTPGGSAYLQVGWYLARLRTLLRLDGDQPIAVEERTVVARDDGLTEIVISTSVPRHAIADPRGVGIPNSCKQRLEFAVIYGGSLTHCEQPSASYFRYFIRLPRGLGQGETHEIGVAITIPHDQPFNPRYTFQPMRRCDEFDLRVRFGAHSQPEYVWHIAGLPRGMVDDFANADALVRPDPAGDIHLRYQHLRIGLAYGARWSG